MQSISPEGLRPAAEAKERRDTIRLLTWNVHKCRGRDGVRDPERVLHAIALLKPDVAVLQEADLKFGRERLLIDPRKAMEIAGMTVCLPEATRSGGIGWRGNALLVRDGITLVSTKSLSLPSLEPRGAAIWRLSRDGTLFEVVGLHLGLVSVFRALQASHLAAVIAGRERLPTVVAGDTNDWRAGSVNMRPLEMVLETTASRHPTFPARRPVLSLDRIMAGRGASVESVWTESARHASDHIPLVSEIRLSKAA